MAAKTLSPEQLQDAKRLKSIYEAKKGVLGINQDSLADACGWHSQGTISQYFNGKIPLNIDASMRFAAELHCKISEFSPTIASVLIDGAEMERGATTAQEGNRQSATVVRIASDEPDIVEVALLMRQMDESCRRSVLRMARATSEDSKAPLTASEDAPAPETQEEKRKQERRSRVKIDRFIPNDSANLALQNNKLKDAQ